MTKDELILNLLEMLKTWIDEERQKNELSKKFWDHSDRLRRARRHKRAKEVEIDALQAYTISNEIIWRFYKVIEVLQKAGVLNVLNDYKEDIQVIKEAIQQYTDKLEADKEPASYICMAGYEEV